MKNHAENTCKKHGTIPEAKVGGNGPKNAARKTTLRYRCTKINIQRTVSCSASTSKSVDVERYQSSKQDFRNFIIPRTKTGTARKRSKANTPSKQDGLEHIHEPPLCGHSRPLGPTWVNTTNASSGRALNVAVFSDIAESMNVCLFKPEDLEKGEPCAEIELDCALNRTGHIWHVAIPLLENNMFYAFRITGYVDGVGVECDENAMLIDPYSVAIGSRSTWGQLSSKHTKGLTESFGTCWAQHASAVPVAEAYDWEGDRPLHIPMEELVIYELHVRGFTAHSSSGVSNPGTYKGLVEKLDYISKLGINAIELMPINEFNELEYYELNPKNGVYRYNVWGYSTVGFFAPMARYAACASDGLHQTAEVVNEFKDMVKACHERGIEVILDVVFNHTAEGNEQGPSLSFRGFSNRVYYMLAPQGEYYNYSGCGNTFNCNHPVVREFIIDCLRYWVTEMHVDGFRFDLASILTRSHSSWQDLGADPDDVGIDHYIEDAEQPTGVPLSDPPLIHSISTDPILKNTKLIAEAWDCDGLNQVGSFPHYDGRWSEWNGIFRDNVRQFIKGTEGPWAGTFAGAICGCPDVYGKAQPAESDWWGNNGGQRWRGTRGPTASINFITAHDGFTLADLVSYNVKHNEANGEENKDGEQHNNSWNCGEEGQTKDKEVVRLRNRQVRNFAVALLTSQGVPMIVMGDEYGHSKGGNNNTYCHDGDINYFQWDVCKKQEGLVRFFEKMIRFRKENAIFRQQNYMDSAVIQWHGTKAFEPDWSDTSKFVAFTLGDGKTDMFYIAFNSGHTANVAELPPLDYGCWDVVADTSKPAPFDFLECDDMLSEEEMILAKKQSEAFLQQGMYPISAYSSIVLKQIKDDSIAEDDSFADFSITSKTISSPATFHPEDKPTTKVESSASKVKKKSTASKPRSKRTTKTPGKATSKITPEEQKMLELALEENRKLKALLKKKKNGENK